MSQDHPEPRNLWSLTVLCLLRVRPMYPYELQRLIREWHKDEFLDLRRGSLYNAIDRLRRDGLIEPVQTSRVGRRPERTVYRLTASGRRAVTGWLQEMLRQPAKEPGQFFAALSFLPHLAPGPALEQLRRRAGLLESEVADLDEVLAVLRPRIGRLVLVEVEYARAMKQAELTWVRALIDDLQSGRLQWDPAVVRREAARATKPQNKSRVK